MRKPNRSLSKRRLLPGCLRSTHLAAFVAMCISPFAAADYVRVEENHPSVSYTGEWTPYYGATLSGGSLVAGGLGATASITFTGTGIHWIEYFSSLVRGGAKVYLDGVLVDLVWPRDSGVIDVYSEKQHRYGITGLADTTHILKIEGTGAPYNFNPLISIDAFYVERGGVTRLVQESDNTITYTGTWVEMDDPSVSGGSVMASREAGATATVRYTGNAISWLSYACPCAAGIARVTGGIPGSGQELVNAYAPAPIPQATIYNEGDATAPVGQERTLKIEVTGNSAAQSPWVVVDAFRVQTGNGDGVDTTPPEITIRAPRDGDIVGGRVMLVHDVFDNDGQFTAVDYYIDGVKIDVDTTQRVTKLTIDRWWITAGDSQNGFVSPPLNGPHVLTAVARDTAGNETRSAPVHVTVSNPNPIVVLRTPNSYLTGTVTISAEVAGEFDATRGVRFWAEEPDGSAVYDLGTDTSAPYSFSRDTSAIPSGRMFVLWAEIFDQSGKSFRSERRMVYIRH
jgi:hypothetical protein